MLQLCGLSAVADMRVGALLSCSVHPMGGTAYLSLESPDEPFLHGVKFTAMPPTKRFRDMEQLSGGEKVTPAAMPPTAIPHECHLCADSVSCASSCSVCLLNLLHVKR